jgi:hypothetical protein
VLVAQGNLPEAVKAFRNGFGIRDRLAKSDPDNAGWQRDLSVSFIKIGDVLVAQGNLPKALKSYRDGHAIAGRLAKADLGKGNHLPSCQVRPRQRGAGSATCRCRSSRSVTLWLHRAICRRRCKRSSIMRTGSAALLLRTSSWRESIEPVRGHF